ncbi:uncharacterized protein PgNI_09150 [Pyricularia grisea]|uniref:FAD-binding FR-type domain-containing protein n=1 Tax=Pyricularia grisea TaxID=148305 RepID=A0A6P8ASS6_PYRGI|nr:uncharacterized protein PgNI_09150 [Pyricularia grisea]TLD05174.1 hypothetical protein PgNI_09150 [Pyricularia grisea]
MTSQKSSALSARHIQDFSNATNVVSYWGYADRVVPCTNDAGSCEYLDLVYESHSTSMLYTGIMWALILGILLVWAFMRKVFPSAPAPTDVASSSRVEDGQAPAQSAITRLRNSIASASRRWLLPESLRWLFGHTTRLQLAVLAIVIIYLTIFSFSGMYYASWITPVKNMPGVYNFRSSLGPWSNRVGVFAYALTPMSVMLASRESILSILTGVPYQSFMFMHRFLGYIMFAQSALHTIGWCIIEIRLYQPQPKVGIEWITQTYMIWGVVAMALLTILVLLSTKWAIRAFGYEFFRKAHYVLAMVYIGGAIAHWEGLMCFLVPGILLWFVDRAARFVRTGLLHYNYLEDGTLGFGSAKASVQMFEDPESGDVVRLDFDHPHQAWEIGQHFFLTFPELSIWQSHPMTPLAPPAMPGAAGGKTGSRHSYVMRAKAGETRKLALLAAQKLAAGVAVADSAAGEKTAASSSSSQNHSKTPAPTVSVILTGPYGQSIMHSLRSDANVLCVAGGTGVTFVLPPLLEIVRNAPVPGRKIEFVWAIRHARDMEWVAPELAELRAASETHNLHIDIYVTRDAKTRSSKVAATAAGSKEESAARNEVTTVSGSSTNSISSGEEVEEEANVAVHRSGDVENPAVRRPKMDAIVDGFVGAVAAGSTTVYASGPLEMIADLRTAVARQNDSGKVWRGEERFDVRLVSDDRVEW